MTPLESLPRGIPRTKLPQEPQTANEFAKIPQGIRPSGVVKTNEHSQVTVMTPLRTPTGSGERTEPAGRNWSYSDQSGWKMTNDPSPDGLDAAGYASSPQLVLGSDSTFWKAEVYARWNSPQEMVVLRTPDTVHKVVTSNLVSLLQVLAMVKDFCEIERLKPAARKGK